MIWKKIGYSRERKWKIIQFFQRGDSTHPLLQAIMIQQKKISTSVPTMKFYIFLELSSAGPKANNNPALYLMHSDNRRTLKILIHRVFSDPGFYRFSLSEFPVLDRDR